MPPGDGNFSTRWNRLKGRFSRAIDKKASEFQKADKNAVSEVFGSSDFERILSKTKTITIATLITFIGTRKTRQR
jgi:hypothetical protein